MRKTVGFDARPLLRVAPGIGIGALVSIFPWAGVSLWIEPEFFHDWNNGSRRPDHLQMEFVRFF